MNAVERDTRYAQPAERSGPQLRTILLTDLVDSTALVERLGDAAAAELFRAHDRLVLGLQQNWRGRLIDRSDGLLLLFERPIDGLGFALDYNRGLLDLGVPHKVELKARAGLHVGEVLTWRNSDEAVRVGAKPVEVEGLAKPMAGRLMTMARPGQILISAVAEPLAHRAARELGERGQHLLWKAHGRWRFKGVPEPQQIFEVGEPGVAPLRTPLNTAKAWRDVPLWRRPAALAAEVALVAVVAVGGWFITRPQPAIAFNERDWVLVADLRNLTTQSVLDDSLEQAFRISLEQSRHVNVLSDLKTRDTLARMQLPADTVIDRDIASEIALRDGARAVILPTVAEVGGRVRFSAEVIDPASQTTVFSKASEGDGVESALSSVDHVTAGLREALGEALSSIDSSSQPLPDVSTKNLDALRAYALGQEAYSRRENAEAMQMFSRATELDPEFALAWIGQMRVHYAEMDTSKALVPLARARSLNDKLPVRERLYLEAWSARFDAPQLATAKWVELAKLYPDYGPAQTNASIWLRKDQRYEEALAFAKAAAVPQNEPLAIDYDSMGRAHLSLGEYDQANAALEQAVRRGYRSSLRRLAAVSAAQRDFIRANERVEQLPKDDRYAYLERIAIALDQGDWAKAQALSSQARIAIERGPSSPFDERAFLMPAAVADWMAGDQKQAVSKAGQAVTLALASLSEEVNPDAEDDAALALAGALLSERLGDASRTQSVIDALTGEQNLAALPTIEGLLLALRAEQARNDGRPEDAVALLERRIEEIPVYQAHVVLQAAYVDAGDAQGARSQAQWLRKRRGLAYGDATCGFCLQALNVTDSVASLLREAQALERAGNDDYLELLETFDRQWPVEGLPSQLRKLRTSLSPTSSFGVS